MAVDTELAKCAVPVPPHLVAGDVTPEKLATLMFRHGDALATERT